MDSDEEEMAKMRASSRHVPNTRRPLPSDDPEEEPSTDVREAPKSPPLSGRAAALHKQAEDSAGGSDDGGDVALGGEGDMSPEMRAFLPVSFGTQLKAGGPSFSETHKVNARQDAGSKAVEAAQKKGGIQFGRPMRDPAAVLGVRSRAGKLEDKRTAAQPTSSSTPASSSTAAAFSAGGAGAEPLSPRRRGNDREDRGTEVEDDGLPLSHEVLIKSHVKATTAIGLDPKGARMAVGGMDGGCKIYDFAGMNEEKNAFREFEPAENHMVQALAFSTTGSCVLAVTSDAHARVYDRDGSTKPIQSTVKGDMYVRSMEHTKGHTQMLTDGVWHPHNIENFATCSLDGTVRLWDLNATPVGMDQVLPSVHVLKTVDRRNTCVGGGAGRAGGLHPTCCAYPVTDSKMIAAGCSDGSVQVFFEKQRYMRPDKILRSTAHAGPVTGLSFVCRGGQSQQMVTRSMDGCVKVWDIRALSDAKGPLKTIEGLPCSHEKSGVCVSPDGGHLLVGVAPQKGVGGGSALRVYDTQNFQLTRSLDLDGKTPTRLVWHKELNQVMVGTSTGDVVMLYSPLHSQKGALRFMGRRAKAKREQDAVDPTSVPVFNMTDPEDIQRFWNTGHGDMSRIRRIEARQNQKTLTPERPLDTKNHKAAPSDMAAFCTMVVAAGAQQLGLNKASKKAFGQEEDSQKALLKYADKDIEQLVGNAYKTTQPKNLLDWSVDESAGDERMSARMGGDFCRKCGQKVCRCVDYSTWGQKRPKTG